MLSQRLRGGEGSESGRESMAPNVKVTQVKDAHPSLFIQQVQDQGLFHLGRLKAERSTAALVDDFAVAANDIEPIGHSAIEMADAVVHAVYHQRDRHLERGLTLARDGASLFVRRGLGETDAFLVVG